MKIAVGIITLFLACPMLGGFMYWHNRYSFKQGFIEGLWCDLFTSLCFIVIIILFYCFSNNTKSEK